MLKIVLYSLYYIVMLGAPISLSIFFPNAATIDLTSVIPALVALLMVWQAYSFGTKRITTENEDVAKKQRDYLICITHSYLIFAPLNFPLIFFLNAWGKSLSLIPFLAAAFAGSAVFKMREKKRENSDSEKESQD